MTLMQLLKINTPALLTKFIQAKDELVTMKLHFRYHVNILGEIHNADKECKYCLDSFSKRQ
jgi:hypothetical protein